jgi:hypothetical protein
MASESEFLERAKETFRLYDKLKFAVRKGKLIGETEDKYDKLIGERISTLRNMELDAFDEKLADLDSSREDLEVQRTDKKISEEAFFKVAESLRQRKEELEAERKRVEGLGDMDYVSIVRKRLKIAEAAEPENYAAYVRHKMLASFDIRVKALFNKEIILAAAAFLVMVVLKYAVKTGQVAQTYTLSINYILAVLAGVLSLDVATGLMRVKNTSMRYAGSAFLAIFLATFAFGLAAVGNPSLTAIMLEINILATFLIIRKVYGLETSKAMVVSGLELVLFIVLLWVFGVPISILTRVSQV